MASSQPFPSVHLLSLLLTLAALIWLDILTSCQSLDQLPVEFGVRVELKRADSGHNCTKLQLIQRSISHGTRRLERFKSMATSPPGDDIQANVHVGEGEFLMNLSIGTPATPFSAIMDTGSDLIWTQCDPCIKCFDQPTPLFNPLKSTTFSNISCFSDLCSDMNIFRCNNGCSYLYAYGDQSSTQGFMARDNFTFEDSMSQPLSIPNIGFGCGVNNQGTGLAQGSGLVGLGRGPLSLISQLGLHKFSYCLTSIGENKTSSLLMGSLADLNYSSASGMVHGTPLVQNRFEPSFYYITLEGITVGETLLPISKSKFKLREDGSGGMIIDSGTTISYIEEDAFDELKKEFVSQMKLRVSEEDATGLDLCFDLPSNNFEEIPVPKLKFHFKGVDLDLPAENYMIADENMGLICLAMSASSGMSILGNVQQQNFIVLHDLEAEVLSFVPTQCDQM